MKKLALFTQISVFALTSLFYFPASTQQSKIDSLSHILDKQANDTFKVKNLYSLSKLYIDSNQHDKGIEFARSGIELSKALKFENGEANCLQNVGLAFYYKGQFDSALVQFEKRLEIVKKLKDTLGIAKTYDNISVIYSHFGKVDEAIDLRKQANQIYEKYNAIGNLASGYTWIGNFYKDQGKYEEALALYLKSLEIYEAENDINNLGYPLLNISSVYRHLKQFDKAKEFAVKAKNALDKAGNKNGVGTSYYRLSLILVDEEKYIPAIPMLLDARSIFTETQNLYMETLTNQVLGTCYIQTGDIDKASVYYKEALVNAEKMGDKVVLGTMFQNIGTEYFAKGNYKQALEYLQKSKLIFTELNDKQTLKEITSNLVELYAKLNQPDSVGAYLKLFRKLADSLYNQQTTTAIAEMQTKYETGKKEQEIQLAAIKIKQQKSWVIFLSIFVFVLLVNSLLFYLYLQNKHKKNLLIAKANMERDLIFKEEAKSKIRNSVSDQTTQKVLEKLVYEIEIKKCYLDPDLNISTLAQKIGTNREYLSQIIHKTYDRNFNDFINFYRVQEAVEILNKVVTGELKNWSMEMIAEKSGFKYTSTFYPAFKLVMNMSPAEFRKALKNN